MKANNSEDIKKFEKMFDKEIPLFIKFYENGKEKYLDNLLSGEVYFNSVRNYFKEKADDRNDHEEFRIIPPHAVDIYYRSNKNDEYKLLIDKDSFLGMRNSKDYVNFSIMNLTSNNLMNIEPEKILSGLGGENASEISGLMIFKDIFLNRLTKQLDEDKYEYIIGKCFYTDKINSPTFQFELFKNGQAKFRKQESLSYQQELRILIKSNENNIIVNLGSLEDIASKVTIIKKDNKYFLEFPEFNMNILKNI